MRTTERELYLNQQTKMPSHLFSILSKTKMFIRACTKMSTQSRHTHHVNMYKCLHLGLYVPHRINRMRGSTIISEQMKHSGIGTDIVMKVINVACSVPAVNAAMSIMACRYGRNAVAGAVWDRWRRETEGRAKCKSLGRRGYVPRQPERDTNAQSRDRREKGDSG